MESNILIFRPPANDDERKLAAGIMAGTDPWITLGISEEQIMETLQDPLYETVLAVSGEEIAGVAVLQMQGACTGYLKSIAVKKEWQHKHVGSRLMDFVEAKIFRIHPNVFLCVSSFNTAAHRFYLKRGYRDVGTLHDYLVQGYDEIMMRKTTGPVLGGHTGEEV